eukprot:CAMPEP_0194505598 /NCGR_PEP_ID=MMETSP0253-20130528/32640_1 /TAXON_ID=2966 /ORGANISM="Noctiluca scintillans" /LENGTH=57 /DNA_ID=CAMNT_0039348183 /DNA_START=16 /DNA_END=186 /DNA_ORIENTATION=-
MKIKGATGNRSCSAAGMRTSRLMKCGFPATDSPRKTGGTAGEASERTEGISETGKSV